MDKLQAIFFAEAEELIGDLERAMLELEKEPGNAKGIKEVFRVMHTLKGSGSMFGYDSLSSFTHDLETIYDSVRSGQMSLTPDILQVTLASIDHLKDLIKDPTLNNDSVRNTHQYLLNKVKDLQENRGEVQLVEDVASEGATWYISLKFKSGVFQNGTNPLFLVDDLVNLGESLVIPHFDEVPVFSKIKVDESYATFELVLYTTAGEQGIREVFIFAEDQCVLHVQKLSDENLLKVTEFRALLQDCPPDKPPFGYAVVRAMADGVFRKAGDVAAENKGPVSKATEVTSIRVSSDKLDELMNLVSELVTSQARLTLLAESHNIADLVNLSENMEKITRRLRDNAFTICLVPIESLVTRFQRLVRDLSRELKKEIEFVAEGTETELDKSIIERITDPILHILRNCIDHGIESPSERTRKGKPAKGTIKLKAFHSGTSVFIQISDDGRGVDPEKIRAKAIKQGLIPADAVLSEKETFDLLFRAGFSTAEKVTDVSGRGVGMDIVRQNIDIIHGEVNLQSKVDEGTTITIKLPLTLSIMDGMLVRLGSSSYVVPLSIVDKCYEIPAEKLDQSIVQKRIFDGNLIPLFNLRTAFGEGSHTGMTQVIKIKYEEFPVAITVDSIIGEYQAVMKPLGTVYRDQDEFSGATILGDGSVALVFDTDKLIRKFIGMQEAVLTEQ